jgi:hypothetical protein
LVFILLCKCNVFAKKLNVVTNKEKKLLIMLFDLFIKKKDLFSPNSLKRFCSFTPFPYGFKENIEGVSHLIFDDYSIYKNVFNEIKKNVRLCLLPKEKIILGNRFRKEILTGYYPRIDLKHINSKIGMGVIALDFIPKGSYVGEYLGVVKKRTRKVMKDNFFCLSYIIHPLKKNYTIDAKDKGNFSRFINHSSTANLESVSVVLDGLLHMIFLSSEDIEPYTQLTFDYGELFWKDFKRKKIEI